MQNAQANPYQQVTDTLRSMQASRSRSNRSKDLQSTFGNTKSHSLMPALAPQNEGLTPNKEILTKIDDQSLLVKYKNFNLDQSQVIGINHVLVSKCADIVNGS